MEKNSTRPILYLLMLVFLMWGCGGSELPFNRCTCEKGLEDRNLIRFEMEGFEEKLDRFVTALRKDFGESKLYFLHYRHEKYDEYFDPGYHALNPDQLSSPYGVQKIMVWDSLNRSDWFPGPLQMSIQIQEHRMGDRPIDPYGCRVELRLRNERGKDMLANCRKARPVQKSLQQLVEQHLGPAHDTTPDPNFPAKEAEWESRKSQYANRVAGILDPACYPAVSHSPGENVLRLQLCELDGMTDTLRGRVEVLSVAGDPLPFLMYDIITDSLEWEVKILDGVSGYRIFFEDLEEVGAILFHFPDGREVKFFEKGDFTRYPYPFKPRISPERIKKRREEELNKRMRPKEKVIS